MPQQGYSSVATYLRGRFRPLAGPDEHELAQFTAASSGPTREEFMAASPLPETVTAFLARLDAKMDAILAGMQSSAMEQDFPHRLDVLAISASGLEFTSALPLAPGDWLEIVVAFRQPSVQTASGIGKVTGRMAAKDGGDVFSFIFTRLREEEREKIIRYVFQEERRRLRETRLEHD